MALVHVGRLDIRTAEGLALQCIYIDFLKFSHISLQKSNPVHQAGSDDNAGGQSNTRDGDTSSGGGDAANEAQGSEMEPEVAEVSVL